MKGGGSEVTFKDKPKVQKEKTEKEKARERSLRKYHIYLNSFL